MLDNSINFFYFKKYAQEAANDLAATAAAVTSDVNKTQAQESNDNESESNDEGKDKRLSMDLIDYEFRKLNKKSKFKLIFTKFSNKI